MNDQHVPITLALVNDYPVVTQGIARMLEDFDRLEVVELAAGENPSRVVDLVLYDAFAARGRGRYDVVRLLEDERNRKLVVYTWHVADVQVQQALDLGIDGYLSKELDADELAEALIRIHQGERVVEPKPMSEHI